MLSHNKKVLGLILKFGGPGSFCEVLLPGFTLRVLVLSFTPSTCKWGEFKIVHDMFDIKLCADETCVINPVMLVTKAWKIKDFFKITINT